ncbi:MAG: hypothetical protein GEV12_00110 [Micromonosporaceae bacterium]|nr:hypothetical protein [Micromonosporaceae bacterium]
MTSNQSAGTTIDWSEGFRVVAGHMELGLTEASPETQGFWDGVERDQLMIKRCVRCGRHLHPRRMGCPDCWQGDLRWVEATGGGTVYSFSTVHRAPAAVWQASAPYCVGIVWLDEGVALFTRLVPDGGGEPSIGDRVVVSFRALESGQKLPVFLVREGRS